MGKMGERGPPMIDQLDLFAPRGPRIRPQTGWRQCDCGKVFWEWPRRGPGAPRRAPTEDTASLAIKEGCPDLQPFHHWHCLRGFDRVTTRKSHA